MPIYTDFERLILIVLIDNPDLRDLIPLPPKTRPVAPRIVKRTIAFRFLSTTA